MTDKKIHDPTEEPAAPQESGAAEAADTSSASALADMQSQLQEALARAEENLGGWQRALADYQNYKKRVERDRISDQEAMKGELIRKVLPILDDLERALGNRPENDPWSSGIELIRRKLQAILEAEGVRRIEAEGTQFDPTIHEAISREPADGTESGRVLAVTLNGYMLGDRVIRPAQVRVAA